MNTATMLVEMERSPEAVAADGVGEVCRKVWRMRSSGRLKGDAVRELGRVLALQVAVRVAESAEYSPEDDRRVLWAREALAGAKAGRVTTGEKDLRPAAGWLLGIHAWTANQGD